MGIEMKGSVVDITFTVLTTRLVLLFCSITFVCGDLQANKKALDLDFAQKYCLLNSQDLTAARLQEGAARFDYLQSISAFLPSVDLSGAMVKLETLPTAHLHQIRITQALLSPEQSIQKAQKRLAWCRAFLAKVTLENRLLLAVRTGYFSCVLKRAIEEDHLNSVRLLQSSLDQERNRLRIGQSTELEVNQMQVALLHVLTTYLESRQATWATEDKLTSLLGFGQSDDSRFEIVDREICPERVFFLKEALALLPDNLLNKDHSDSSQDKIDQLLNKAPLLFDQALKYQFYDDIIKYQPSLKMAKLELKNGQLAVREIKSHFWPHITADFTRNNINFPNGTLVNSRQRWQAQLNVKFRLFDGFGRQRGVRSSQLRALALQVQLEKKQMDLKRKISEQIHLIEAKILAYCAARQGALVAKRALSQAQERYRLGQITPLDFRQCANQFLHAKVLKESAGYDALVAYYELCSDGAKEHRAELDYLDRLLESV